LGPFLARPGERLSRISRCYYASSERETEFGELGSMPKSKSKRRRTQPLPRKKRKPSPRWFGLLILGTMFAGVIVIVVNYLGLIPGTGGSADNLYLFVGLGAIAMGFLLATQWY